MQTETVTIAGLIDRARQLRGHRSDYQFSKATGLPPNSISNWRHGRSLPDEKACEIIATAAAIDPDYLIASVQSLRAHTEAGKTAWARIAARLAAGVHVFLACFLFATNYIATDAHAALLSGHPPAETIQHDLPYVKRLCDLFDAIFSMGLLAAVFWLLAHDSGAFTPCFVPQK